MKEYERLVELLNSNKINDDTSSFLEDFDSFMHDMDITVEKKQLIRYKGDFLPSILSINC